MKRVERTKPWITTVSVGVLVLLFFLIVWLLLGEINLLDKNMIIPYGGLLWKGIIDPLDKSTIDFINDKYSKFLEPNWSKGIETKDYYAITSAVTYFDNSLLIYLFIGLAIALIYPLIFRWLGWGNYDIYPFSITTAIFCITFFLSYLIPTFGLSNEFWYDLVRILLAAVVALIFFLISNYITNRFYITKTNAQQIAYSLKNEKAQADVYNNDLKDLLDHYHNENDKDYVDFDK